ncbi:hypothetical protein KA021_02700 [Candidatus Saccharibacteria bacterium]|jgi:hypothetical protein|nr:hypothetical protein [Candidatus Saccharibacteria bacterium]
MASVYTINLPEYRVDSEPNHQALGKVVDRFLQNKFQGETIVVRGISSRQHPGKTPKELIDIIQQLGTDRYDPFRVGDRYNNVHDKRIDIFAFRRKVTPKMQLFKNMSWGFYHGAKTIHGSPIRIDIMMIYDAKFLKSVAHRYEGRDDIKRDGFIFKDPEHKREALLGILYLE